MTFPGVPGITGKGVLGLTAVGQQIRQSFAGTTSGVHAFGNVVNAMGSHAPAWATTAAAVTVMEEYAAEPHPIEMENFELPASEGGIDQFGVDQTDPSHFDDNPDANAAMTSLPYTVPFQLTPLES